MSNKQLIHVYSQMKEWRSKPEGGITLILGPHQEFTAGISNDMSRVTVNTVQETARALQVELIWKDISSLQSLQSTAVLILF